MSRSSLFLVALLCSCGGDDEEPYVLFASGDRLIAEYYAVSDVQLFMGFYDKERGERCAFTVVPTSPGFNVPGASYCLPTVQLGSGWFADASCTERLAWVDADVAARAAIEPPADACVDEPRVYELGENVDATSAYSVDANGACVPYSAIGGPAPPLRRIGPPLELDAFVKAEHQIAPLSDRMGALMVKADDGARLTLSGFDRKRNEATHPYGNGYELFPNRWWPRQAAYSVQANRQYADAGCTKPIATKETSNALCPITAIMEYVDSDCGYQIAHFAAGLTVDAISVHAIDEQGSCAPAPAGQVRAVEFGVQLTADDFAELTTVDQGAGPVVLRLYGTPDRIGVLPVSNFPLFDREREWPCEIAMATDGTDRCLPGSFGVGAFSDPACTQRIVGFDIAMAGCEPSPPPTAVRLTADGSDGGNPDQHYAAFPVAEKIPQPASVYYIVNGACEPHYAGPALYDWHALGPEVTVDELPRVRRVLASPP